MGSIFDLYWFCSQSSGIRIGRAGPLSQAGNQSSLPSP